MLSIDTAGLDIRTEMGDDSVNSFAWAWEAGVASADLTLPESEDEGDMSIKMTAFALAVNTLAMLAM